MSNDSLSAETLVSDFAKSLPLLTAFSATIAYAYEAGFCARIGASMHDILDVSDLLKTSIFTIPFLLTAFVIGVVIRLSDDESARKLGMSENTIAKVDRQIFWLFISLSVLDFINVLLLGSRGEFRLWHLGAAVAAAFWISSCRIFRDHFVSSIILYFRLLLLVVFSTFFWARGDASDALHGASTTRPTIDVSGDDWTVVRRYSTHLVAFDGVDTLTLITHDGRKVFAWSYTKVGWRGFLCSEPPSVDFPTFNRSRCMFPWSDK